MTTFTWTTGAGEIVPLDGSSGVSLTLPVLGLDVPPVELQIEQRIAYDGAVVFRYRIPQRPFSLSLNINESVASMRNVARWFANPALPGTLTATTGGQDRTLEGVVYQGGLEGEYSSNGGGGGLTWRQVTVDFLAMEPWWQGPLQSTFLNVGAATAFDDATVTFDVSTTPFDGGSGTLVAVPGDTYAFPMFVITGPFSALALDGGNLGESVALAAPLANGSQIVIDSDPGNRGPRLNGGDIAWSLLTVGSRLWTLTSPADSVAISAIDGVTQPHANFPAATTGLNLLSIPDAVNISAPTQLDIRFAVDGVASQSGVRTIVGHYDNTGNIRSYLVRLTTTDQLEFVASTDGIADVITTCAAAFTTSDAPILGRVTWRSSDGRVQFFTKPHSQSTLVADMAGNTGWVQLGTDGTGPLAALFNSTDVLSIGNRGDATLVQPYVGRIFSVTLATTIDAAPVFDMQPANIAADPAASFVATSGQTVTVTRAGSGPALSTVTSAVSTVELRWRNRYLTP